MKRRMITKVCEPETKYLGAWEEALGTFKGFEFNEDYVVVILSLTNKNLRFSFSLDSIEAEILKKELDQKTIGKKIALLRTDNYAKPIVIRKCVMKGTNKKNSEDHRGDENK
jgi:hypothetical protein